MTLDGLGIVAIGSGPLVLTATVYNDATHAGVVLMPLTASGFGCTSIGANSCGTLSALTALVVSGTTTTSTVTYTPPSSLPGAPYDRRDYEVISVAPARPATGNDTVYMQLHLDVLIHLGRLSRDHLTAPLLIALSAVVEQSNGSLSYWALKHPPGRPDFHHADGYVLELAGEESPPVRALP